MRKESVQNLIFIFILLVLIHFSGNVYAQTSSFVFSAGGDHGAPNQTDTRKSFQAIKNMGAVFHMALGDMSYGDTNANNEPFDGTTPSPWCSGTNPNQNIKLILGETFPMQLVVGNHEDDGNDPIGDGWIKNYALCLPDRMGSSGLYGVQYRFDYPKTGPLMRVIMISPDITVYGKKYDYSIGTDRDWLIQSIDSARTAGIPWVVVGMHKNCITMGTKPCEIGESVMNLLIEKKVDLILQGHDHNYQRGKQLAINANCSGIISNSVNANCIADTGADGIYTKGKGPVIIISGMFGGAGFYALNCIDPDQGYIAKAMGGDGNIWNGSSCQMAGVGRGVMKFTVQRNRIDGQFIMTEQQIAGTPFTDSFSIDVNAPTSTPTPTQIPVCIRKSEGDANCDGVVNLTDFEIFRKEFTGTLTTKTADFDLNGTVNIVDFEILRKSLLK